MALPILCLLALACTAPKSDKGSSLRDPGAPAVVRAPPVVLPSDTMKRPSEGSSSVKLDAARQTIATNYAVLGAAIAFGDRRMIGASYAPDAEVVTPDRQFRGLNAIVNGLASLGVGKSLKEFQRRSLVTTIVDSTVIDSGTYVMLIKRVGADTAFERGRYATTWRVVPPPHDWVIVSDHLFSAAAKTTK